MLKCHMNQPNKNKLLLYKPLLSFNIYFKQLCTQVTRWNTSVIKVDVVCMGI